MSDELLQRRELLRRAAWMLGGAVSAPAALAILQGCSAKEAAVSASAYKPVFLTGASHMDMITEIAEIIIPKTKTSGAKDAGVPAFIDSVLAAVYPTGKWELYDIEADRTEQNNLAPQHPDLVRKMVGMWEVWAKQNNVLPWIWNPPYGATKP